MRAYLVVLALLATPLAVATSQMPGNSSCDNGNGDDTRSDSGSVHAHQGACAPQPPPPPPPPPPTCGQLPASGASSVTGQVYQDVAPSFPGLQGWCVDLTGTDAVGNIIAGNILTDAFGNFTFSVPGGTYTVCEEIQSGWTQTFPPAPQGGAVCPTGFGYQFTVPDGGSAGFNNFGNVTP